jgi:hypothetical protein
LEEQLLARRALHFSQNEIFFECRELQASETFPAGLPPILGETDMDMEISIKSNFAIFQMKPRQDIKEALGIWWHIVSIYTQCSLTYHKDKIIAISGIARDLKESFRESEYLAGLWDYNLPFQLLWTAVGKRGGSTRPNVYVAPSWSWASVACPVALESQDIWKFGSIQDTGIVKIKDAKMQTLYGDEMGPVTGGVLRIIGMLLPGTIEQNSEFAIGCFPRSQESPPNRPGESCTWVRLDDTSVEAKGTHYFVPFYYTRTNPMGLVLKHIDGFKGRFERVGVFGVFGSLGERWRDPWSESISTKRATKEGDELITENLWEEYDEETDRYTFTIV